MGRSSALLRLSPQYEVNAIKIYHFFTLAGNDSTSLSVNLVLKSFYHLKMSQYILEVQV